MKKIEIIDLYDMDYSLKVINAMKQQWKRTDFFSCIGNPKCYNLLLYLNGCDAVYTLKNGEKIKAGNGSIVYNPLNSEYSVKFCNFKNEASGTVGINFLLYDSSNLPFVLSEDIQVFCADNSNYSLIFNKIANYSQANIQCRGKIKSIMYDILFKLSEYYHNDYCDKYHNISKGIAYLEQDEEQKLKISEIADMCNVSEVYFRKLFKEYSGMSPAQYRTVTKIYRAKNYLKQENLSVSEI